MVQEATPAHAITAESRYRLLVDAITDYAIYMLDPDGIVTSWNLGAERFKGYTADEIIGQHFSRFYTEEDRAVGLPAEALRIAAQEGRFEREGWRVRKEGGRFWAHVVIDPIRAPGGELIGYAKITRDLSERREAELALRRSEEQFRLLVQGVTDYAIYMLDNDGQVSSWNAGAERFKGYRPDEIIGQHFSRFYSEEDRAAGIPQKGLDAARREGRFETEGWRVRKDGSRFWAHVVIDPIRGEDGTPIGFAKVTRDITERRAAQEALDEARQALFQSQKMEAVGQKLYFPRYLGAEATSPSTEETLVPTSSEHEIVLVVEDNDAVRAQSVMSLTELGYRVLEAHDAEAALVILESRQEVDLLFTDVVLPGKSGRVLAEEVAKLRPGLKVLFTTGYSQNAIVHQGRLDADVQLISKPFTHDQLARRVRDTLDQRPVERRR